MTFSPSNVYFRLVLGKPRTILSLLTVLVIFFAWHSIHFRLDASSDSLLLENDQALKYYLAIEARYGADDFLVITYTPNDDLFSAQVKKDLRALSNELLTIQRVKSVVTILDVPLIDSPPVTLSDIQKKILTLESPETDQLLARKELLSSPLYKNMLISSDGTTTAIQVNFKRDQNYIKLRDRRNYLREKQLEDNLIDIEKDELMIVSKQFDQYSVNLQKQQHDDIVQVRQIMTQYQDKAKLFLGGIPMITSDSIEFIRHDLMTFGIGVLIFLIVLLTVIFLQPRWVILPMITCGVAGLVMIGFLGWVDWPVTVVSSNFISLMLIITLSLMVHLIVHYRELQVKHTALSHHALIQQTIISKFKPSFYTAITSIVAFASLIVSGIRPVIDFGWMMTIGISMSFVLAFTLFPALLSLLPATPYPKFNYDITHVITRFFARLIQRFDKSILLLFVLIAILSAAGMTRLSVDNRFIDYYKENTEIYQGMTLIDKKLGGTTPLDIIIDAPAEFFQVEEDTEEDLFDEFDLEREMEEEGGITSTSYWFNSSMIPEIDAIHDYLVSLPESGKVLSISSSMRLLRSLEESMVLDDLFLSILYKRLPDNIKEVLFNPYMSEDGTQLRFNLRVYETDPSLKRQALLRKIQLHLTEEMGLADEQVHLTGMLVLYNNLLQSLFKSQILTIGVVFMAIFLMFIFAFRSFKMALLAIIPNILAASMVLGLMGGLHISLDIMTITIAAICIGIAVDDSIHYVHRFSHEFGKDHDYWAAVRRSHASIGRAMYYTTITITLGFSILALSNFVPTIYFGLLTGLSMIVALLANLMLLPILIVRLKPLG